MKQKLGLKESVLKITAEHLISIMLRFDPWLKL
jgi:hypothetical protein